MPILVSLDSVVNSDIANGQLASSMSILTDGRYVVTWHSKENGSDDNIKARIFNADGTAVGPELIVNNDPGELANTQQYPTVTSLPGGGFAVVWQSVFSQADYDVKARFFSADGTALGDEFLATQISGAVQFNPVVSTLSDGRVVMAWESNNSGSGFEIKARVFNADGTPSSSEFLANETGVADHKKPTITALADGYFAIAWQTRVSNTQGSITARIFNADGSAVAGEFLVDSGATSNQSTAAMTAFGTGMIVTWVNSDGGNNNIFARIIKADGTAAGTEFHVNSTTAGNQFEPAVTQLADGRTMVTWESESAATGLDIKARIFNEDGTASGDEFLVSSTTTRDQLFPTVASLPNGEVILTWTSNSAGLTDFDIYQAKINPLIFNGTLAADTWSGGKLGDKMTGLAGDDVFHGNGGNDTIAGGDGSDLISGDADDDQLDAGANNDTVSGGTGADTIFGGGGNDLISGDAGEDQLDGGADNDTMLGGTGSDTVIGGDGEDDLSGGAGTDQIDGGNGNDKLAGGDGDDALVGGIGKDFIYGGLGADTITGGPGKDKFFYGSQQDGGDSIVNFRKGDHFVFQGSEFGGLKSGALKPKMFIQSMKNKAIDGNDHFIFRVTDDTLWYDPDGKGGHASIKIADLANDFNLKASDILIV